MSAEENTEGVDGEAAPEPLGASEAPPSRRNFLKGGGLVAAGLAVSPVETNARGVQCYCRGPSELLVEVSCRRRT